MPHSHRSFGAALRLGRRRWNLLTIGGDWALSLPAEIRYNLHWFFYDSVFAAASDNVLNTYLTFYILALGASSAQIGYLSSLSGLIAAAMLLPGAVLTEKWGRRKDITVFFGGGLGRVTILLLALLPLALTGNMLVWVAIILVLFRSAFGNLAYPAWMSLVGDMIPVEGRGRFFGSRNFMQGVAGMSATLLVGLLISRMAQPLGYQIALMIAFVIGMISTYSFWRIKDPDPSPAAKVLDAPKASLHKLWGELRQHSGFIAFGLTMIIWNFSLNIAGPFFSVYMAQELHVSPTLIAINSTASTIVGMSTQLFAGRLADRWGPRRLQMIAGLLIPIMPFMWVFAKAGWHAVLINTVAAGFWGMYNLAAFNLLLELTPEEQRARYSAIYQLIVTLSLSAGAAFGGLLIGRFNFNAVFIGSGIGRMTAALIFAALVRTNRLEAGRQGNTPPDHLTLYKD